MGKAWYTSKTMWVGALLVAGGLLNQFAGLELPLVADAGWLDSVLGVVIIVLRAVTDKPVEWS